MTRKASIKPAEITARKMARVRRLRLAHGISQEAVARRVDISREHYACVEAGKSIPSSEIFFRIVISLRAIIRELEAARKAA